MRIEFNLLGGMRRLPCQDDQPSKTCRSTIPDVLPTRDIDCTLCDTFNLDSLENFARRCPEGCLEPFWPAAIAKQIYQAFDEHWTGLHIGMFTYFKMLIFSAKKISSTQRDAYDHVKGPISMSLFSTMGKVPSRITFGLENLCAWRQPLDVTP